MTKRAGSFLLLVVGIAILVCGCVVSPRRNTVNRGVNGKLYVATAGSILRFGGGLQATGNVTPEATITGSQTQISSPQRLFIDVANDRLLVANQGAGSILIFTSASTTAGNFAPRAALTSTGNMLAPLDLAIDPTTGIDLLYVADGQNVLVFSAQSTLSGNVNNPPVRIINFGFTIGAILLDVANNRLFVADAAGNTIDILPNASTASGSATGLVTTISGSSTLLQRPNALAFDTAGRLMVSNLNGPTITIYPASAIPAGGNVAPVASLVGSNTGLSSPGQMAFNSSAGTSGELFVADSLAASIFIYRNPGSFTLNDNLTPSRTISGSNTGLTTINGVALDTTR
jgi:hypothetical protein